MRYPTARQAPSEPTFEGDPGFIGLHMKLGQLDRGKLGAGYYVDAMNKRVASGVASKRFGSYLPAFCNTDDFENAVFLGSGLFSNPYGTLQLLIATATAVWRIGSGSIPLKISLPDGVTLTDRVHFVQTFNRVLLLRGTDEDDTPLEWDGTATGNFVAVTKKYPAVTTTKLIPNVARGVSFSGRFVFPFNRTDVGLSSIGDYTSYDPILADILLNLGTSDLITRLYPYAKTGLIVSKENRTELFTGFSDPSQPELARLEVLSNEIGSCAWDSWAMVGGDCFFLSRPGGIFRISEVIQDRIAANAVPVSDQIEPLIRRIHWPAADQAVAAIDGIYYVIALPIDGSLVNNYLARYNTVAKEWEGYDTWPAAAGMQIDALHSFDYNSARRLYAVNYAHGSIHLLDEGKFDETKAGRFPIADRFATRGYATMGWNGMAMRDVKRLEVTLGTWDPSIAITMLTERANDERPLTSSPITADPRKWNVWGKSPVLINNSNEDHGTPGRQDYSVDYSTLEPTAGLYLEGGIDFEKKQFQSIPFAIRAQSRWTALLIESTQGDCDICGVSEESSGAERALRRAA